ncbi:MAG: hypothetical protein JSU96_00915 [Acidobacteriota bacterium]|nr:MAG: hypothetical protein JSU96_00915 [Acidobacteriota bacterium]
MSMNLVELSTEQLTKKKKFATFIPGVLVGVAIIVIVTAMSTGKYQTLLAAVGLAAVSIPMISGLRRINDELSRRSEDKA